MLIQIILGASTADEFSRQQLTEFAGRSDIGRVTPGTRTAIDTQSLHVLTRKCARCCDGWLVCLFARSRCAGKWWPTPSRSHFHRLGCPATNRFLRRMTHRVIGTGDRKLANVPGRPLPRQVWLLSPLSLLRPARHTAVTNVE